MDDPKSVFERGTETLMDAGKHLVDGYKTAMGKVTGAESARNMEAMQSEMEVVYSAIVMRIIALEEATGTLENTVETLQVQTSELGRKLRTTRIAAFALGILAIAAILIVVLR
jgi:hypothetical protein